MISKIPSCMWTGPYSRHCAFLALPQQTLNNYCPKSKGSNTRLLIAIYYIMDGKTILTFLKTVLSLFQNYTSDQIEGELVLKAETHHLSFFCYICVCLCMCLLLLCPYTGLCESLTHGYTISIK